jgi:hypothetical protein
MEIEMGWERKQRRRRVLFLEDGMSKFPGTLMAVYDNDNMNVLHHIVCAHHPRVHQYCVFVHTFSFSPYRRLVDNEMTRMDAQGLLFTFQYTSTTDIRHRLSWVLGSLQTPREQTTRLQLRRRSRSGNSFLSYNNYYYAPRKQSSDIKFTSANLLSTFPRYPISRSRSNGSGIIIPVPLLDRRADCGDTASG